MGGRNDQANVRLTDDEKRLVNKAAKRAARSLSEWMRIVVLDRASKEIGGAPPVVPPNPEEAATLEGLRRIEAAHPTLPDDLLDLGEASIRRPRLARALSELAAEARGGGPLESGERGQKGPRLLPGKE